MKWMIAAILLLALPPAAVGADDIDRLRNYYSRAGFQWVASHESADTSANTSGGTPTLHAAG